MTDFLSDRLKATRDAFKRHAHGGKRFSSDEIIGLVERFDELFVMARSQESELSRHQRNEAGSRKSSLARIGNVVPFPGARAGIPQPPLGGGDAA